MSTATRWELHAPPGWAAPGWLDEVSEFRGRVLYEGGRRPAFRTAAGAFADPDPLDRLAYHVVARVGGAVVGCVRLLPLGRATGLTESLLGPDRFAATLWSLGVGADDTLEGGRWVTDPDHRASRLGVHLAAGGVAAARDLGFGLVVCPTGTRRKQDRILARLGLWPVEHLPPIPAPAFDDELRVMCVRPADPAPHFGELMDGMAEELGLAPTTTALPAA